MGDGEGVEIEQGEEEEKEYCLSIDINSSCCGSLFIGFLLPSSVSRRLF